MAMVSIHQPFFCFPVGIFVSFHQAEARTLTHPSHLELGICCDRSKGGNTFEGFTMNMSISTKLILATS